MNNIHSENLNIQTPTIVSIAESTHYLVGIYDSASNFIGINNTDDIVSFSSLFEAKKFLRKRHISSANIEYQSAYDEMCGSQTLGAYSQTIKL